MVQFDGVRVDCETKPLLTNKAAAGSEPSEFGIVLTNDDVTLSSVIIVIALKLVYILTHSVRYLYAALRDEKSFLPPSRN